MRFERNEIPAGNCFGDFLFMQKDKYKKRRDTFTLSSLSSGRRGYSPQMDISSEFEYEISELRMRFSLVNIFNILFRESCFPWEQQ